MLAAARRAGVICVLQFDAASVAALERLLAEGRLPNLAALSRARAAARARDARRSTSPRAPSTRSTAASSSATTGSSIRSSGRAGEQRARYATAFEAPPAVWERLARAGPADAGDRPVREPPAARRATGRLRLRLGVRRPGRAAALVAPRRAPGASYARRLGRGPRGDRDLRPPAPREPARAAREAGRGAGAGSRRSPSELLARERFDLAWLTFSAAHLAGHQFWDLSQLDPAALGRASARDARARRSTMSTSPSTRRSAGCSPRCRRAPT